MIDPPPATGDGPLQFRFSVQPSVLAQADPHVVENFMRVGHNGFSAQQQSMAPQLQIGNQTIPSRGGAASTQPTNMMNSRSIPMNTQQFNNVAYLEQNNMNVQYPQYIQGNPTLAVQGSNNLAPHNFQAPAMFSDPGPSTSTTSFDQQQQCVNPANLMFAPQAGSSSAPSGNSGLTQRADLDSNQFFDMSGMLPNGSGGSANVDPNGNQIADYEEELAIYNQIAAQPNQNGSQNSSNQQWS